MGQTINNLLSLIHESSFSDNEKELLLTSLKKNGIMQEFADLFAEALSRRGEIVAATTTNFDAQFKELLEQFEKEGVLLEQEHSAKVSLLDPLDTAGEQDLLDVYTTALKKQRSAYEKKTRDLTVELTKAMQKIS